jgi:hypothetical protein
MAGSLLGSRLVSCRAALLCPLLFACASATDLGAECTLVKKNPDGGNLAVPVTEGELPLTRSDYISFGSPLCLDACARDADQQRTGDNAAPVKGYCSHDCGSDADCGKGYSCRSLLLDEATLNSICTSNPARCRSFGGTAKPLYCVRISS